MTAAGHPVQDIRRIASSEVAAAAYLAMAPDGSEWHITYLGRDLPEADWLYHAWRILAFREVEDEAATATPGHRAAREAYLTLLAERARVSVAPVVGVIEAGGGALVVRSWVPGSPMLPGRAFATPDVLEGVWAQLAILHTAGLSHGALRGDHIIVGQHRPVIISFGLGRDGASGQHKSKDVAELLVAVALVSDQATAVRDAAAALGKESVAQALPSLQPLVLSAVTRHRLTATPALLDGLRQEVAKLTGATAPPVQPRTRVALRNLLPLVALGTAIYLLLPQVAQAGATTRALGAFHWIWLPAIILCSAATYVIASVALIAAVGRPLAVGRTTAAQLAAAFTNRLAPAGLGAMATEVRYLQASGVPRGDAVSAVALKSLVGIAVHAVGLVALVLLATSSHVPFTVRAPGVPERWELLVFTAIGLAVVGLVAGGFRFRHMWLPVIRDGYERLRTLGTDPMRAFRLVGASAALTAAYALALVIAVEAVGGGPIVAVLAVYLGASAVGAAAPTPGGLGAVEAGLVAGLAAAGIHTGEAITAVLLFRLITYWGPVVPGAVSFWLLRRAGAL
ncbi:MAG TPA: lysylphosphatidylglycerol synthase domain-containing protein [Acidimicrobiales bacterium]|nr:lysylphosphatidylglycerol synthase domain-containing protein [Acidimicrobiales bacterium]